MDSTRMSSSVEVGHELAMTCHSSDAVGNCLVEVAHHLERALALGHMLEGDTGELQTMFAEVPWQDVQAAINEEDEEKAADLIAYLSQDLGFQGL